MRQATVRAEALRAVATFGGGGGGDETGGSVPAPTASIFMPSPTPTATEIPGVAEKPPVFVV